MVMTGWDVQSGILADVLRGAEPRHFWSTNTSLEKMYQARL